MGNELSKRIFNFVIRVLKYIRQLKNTEELKVIKYQIAKSSSSTGANYEEAQAGVSKADFSNKVAIALKEMRETNYWLRVIKALDEKQPSEKIDLLIDESEELKKILGSIVSKTRSKF